MQRKKILIIRFHAIGDVVLSTIIPQSIKQLYSNYEIHYLTGNVCKNVLENCPYVDKILVFNNSIISTLKILRQEKYDIIISLNYTLKNYVLTYLSFPKKVSFKSFIGKSWIENYFYTAKKLLPNLKLPKNLHLINSDEQISNTVSNMLKQYPKPHIFINPGKHKKNPRQGRVWNIKKWQELANKILSKYGGTIFVNGNYEEKEYHTNLNGENIVVLSGALSLKECCAALSLADLVISGDSGPAHIASAYNTKTLVLLGSTSPDKIKPYGENGYYIEPTTKCKYCWKKKCKMISSSDKYTPCMESIEPDTVMEKIFINKLL